MIEVRRSHGEHGPRRYEKTVSDDKRSASFFVEDGTGKVAVRGVASGTHEGEFMGHPPTGRSFSVEHVHWFRIESGRLAEPEPAAG